MLHGVVGTQRHNTEDKVDSNNTYWRGREEGGREKEHPKRNPSYPNTLCSDSSALVTHKWADCMHVTAAETLPVDSGHYFLQGKTEFAVQLQPAEKHCQPICGWYSLKEKTESSFHTVSSTAPEIQLNIRVSEMMA